MYIFKYWLVKLHKRATLTEEMANQLLNEEGANMSAYNPDYEIPMERLEFGGYIQQPVS